jgi:hypothetical protein
MAGTRPHNWDTLSSPTHGANPSGRSLALPRFRRPRSTSHTCTSDRRNPLTTEDLPRGSALSPPTPDFLSTVSVSEISALGWAGSAGLVEVASFELSWVGPNSRWRVDSKCASPPLPSNFRPRDLFL